MVVDDSLDARLSVISLAVAADSGWYDVDFSRADPYGWAKNKGCTIFTGKCVPEAISEFCAFPGIKGCSDDFTYINICTNSRRRRRCFIDLNYHSCKVSRPTRVKSFSYGQSSICQKSKVSTQIFNLQMWNGRQFGECYSIECNRSGTQYTVFTHSGFREMQFVCTRKGERSRGIAYGFDFECQDPVEVCKPKTTCGFDCHFR